MTQTRRKTTFTRCWPAGAPDASHAGRRRPAHLVRRTLPVALGVVLTILAAIACDATVPGGPRPSTSASVAAPPVNGAAPAAASPAPGQAEVALPMRLTWASTEYFAAGPADPVVQILLIVANDGN